MKIMKLIYPLAFALAITLATTGCHNHKPMPLTPLPGSRSGTVGGETPTGTLPQGNPINPNPDVNAHIGSGIPVAGAETFEGMIEDRAALGAYTIHFAYDSSAIKKTEQSNLLLVAEALRADTSAKLLIEGNCDERGTQEYNRSLGERRALAAREALAKLGIDPSRVRTLSWGKDKPVDPANNQAAWEKNRRDDFVLLRPKAGS
jgi:outer membrane protein OmpA-like peptidoglycan-associated protein